MAEQEILTTESHTRRCEGLTFVNSGHYLLFGQQLLGEFSWIQHPQYPGEPSPKIVQASVYQAVVLVISVPILEIQNKEENTRKILHPKTN